MYIREILATHSQRNFANASRIYLQQHPVMQKLCFVAFLVVVILAFEVSCQESMLMPPNRPSEFKNPDELRRYLKALNEYYAIVGRPRFGRDVSKRSPLNSLAESLSAKASLQ